MNDRIAGMTRLQALPRATTLAIAPHLLQPETWVSG